MSIEEKCNVLSPSDKEYYEQSIIYLTNVFFDAYPQLSIESICNLAQTHLNLFKTIHNTLNERYREDSGETDEEFNLESPTIHNININDIHSPEKKEIQKNSKSEFQLRPSNPKRSPSKFSKDSYEYKQFIKYYTQKLRDKKLGPNERSIKVNEKWNSMNTEEVLRYLKKHEKRDQ